MNKPADDTATTIQECACMLGQFRFDALMKLRSAGEFRVDKCLLCGQQWLVVEHEEPAFSRSGEWYALPLTAEEAETVTADNGFELFERGAWYWAGGSLYDGRVRKHTGKLVLAAWLA